MSEALTLELVDVESAKEQALDGGPTGTRADLFKKAVLGGGTFLAGGLLIGGLPKVALGKPSAKQDAEILNFALFLEYLESEFYIRAVNSGALSGDVLNFATVVRDHEVAHRDALLAALGNAANPKPTFDFGDTVTNQDKFVATSIVLEDTGVTAYNGQGTRLTKATLAVAASIVSVEARHAAWIRHIAFAPNYDGAKTFPAPSAFDRLASAKQVTEAVAATGFVKG